MHTLHKSLLIILLASTPFCKALPDWATNNGTHILWGTGTLIAAGATYFLTTKSSEATLELAKLSRLSESEKKANDERAALEQASDLLQPFNSFIEKFRSVPTEQLAKNKDFERELLVLIRGNSSNPQFLNTFNTRVAQAKNELYIISNTDLTDDKKRFLEQLNFILLHANNSAHIDAIQQENTVKQLEMEHAKHMKQISAERAMQARIETESIKRTCALNEQTAEEQAQTSRALQQTAQNMSALFNRATANIQGQVTTIGTNFNDSLIHGFEELTTWQKARALEHAETRSDYAQIASLIPILVNALNAAQQTINCQGAQLNNIEDKLDHTKEAAEAILINLPADSRIALEKHIAHIAYESEQRIMRALADALNSHQQAMYAPSAPPMESPEHQ